MRWPYCEGGIGNEWSQNVVKEPLLERSASAVSCSGASSRYISLWGTSVPDSARRLRRLKPKLGLQGLQGPQQQWPRWPQRCPIVGKLYEGQELPKLFKQEQIQVQINSVDG